MSWLHLFLSLYSCLPLPGSRASIPDPANLHYGKGRRGKGAATAHKTYLVPGFTVPSVPGKQKATQPQTLRLEIQLLPPDSLQSGWINQCRRIRPPPTCQLPNLTGKRSATPPCPHSSGHCHHQALQSLLQCVQGLSSKSPKRTGCLLATCIALVPCSMLGTQ